MLSIVRCTPNDFAAEVIIMSRIDRSTSSRPAAAKSFDFGAGPTEAVDVALGSAPAATGGSDAEVDTRAGVGAVENALRLLQLYRERELLGVSETARLLRVGRSTAHRLLTTLRVHGFVVQDSSRAYRVGPALRELGAAIAESRVARARCRVYMQALCDELGETVNLVSLRGTDAVFVDSVETRRPLRVAGREGVVLPAHAVSAGKALLAALPVDVLRELYAEEALTPLTERTLRTRTALEAQLELVRDLGYAVNIGESERGITAAACAIPGRAAGERLAIAVSAPSSRVHDEDDLLAVAQAVCACAERLASGLGAGSG
jgi:IclR family acetate operon transcriptional repressor